MVSLICGPALFAFYKKGSLRPPLGFCVPAGSSGSLLRASLQNTESVGGASDAMGTNGPELQGCPLFDLGTAGWDSHPFERASPAATSSALRWLYGAGKEGLAGLGCHLVSQGPEDSLAQGTQGTKEQDTGWLDGGQASCLFMTKVNHPARATFSFIWTLEDGDIDTFTFFF